MHAKFDSILLMTRLEMSLQLKMHLADVNSQIGLAFWGENTSSSALVVKMRHVMLLNGDGV